MTGRVRRLDDNLELRGDAVHCRRCHERTGTSTSWLDLALIREHPAAEGGTLLRAAPELYVDAPVIHRQAFCPGCLTLLLTEVIATEHRGRRSKQLGAVSGPDR